MNSFTFVTLSYNHENQIIEHLESIKNIVSKFGNGIDVFYVLSDDCSKDNTVMVVMSWIKKNPIFRNTIINRNDNNIGTVKNFIKAVSLVKTEDFKLLAGDDVYGFFDIFKLYANFGDSILITPITPFGKYNKEKCCELESNYRLLMYFEKCGKFIDSLLLTNLIPAPGVFYKRSIFNDKKFIDFLNQFTLIEDYPMWYYLFKIKNKKFIVKNHSYIYYRIGTGVTSKSALKHPEYLRDYKKIIKIIRPKDEALPKYINPYKYYLKFLRIKVEYFKEKYPIELLVNKDSKIAIL